ncbi:MAG: hypothetical protein AAGT88_07180 [Dethiobacter sp.]
MDRGIATKSNIELIQNRVYHYTVIERAAVEKEYIDEYAKLKNLLGPHKNTEELSRLGWSEVREDQNVYVRLAKVRGAKKNKAGRHNSQKPKGCGIKYG